MRVCHASEIAGARRSFTAEYKLRIVAEYHAYAGDGDKSALPRREGLYSSHITEWRRARDNAAQSALATRGRKTKVDPDTATPSTYSAGRPSARAGPSSDGSPVLGAR